MRAIDATKLSSEHAINEQVIRASGQRRGTLAVRLRNAELLSHSDAKDLF